MGSKDSFVNRHGRKTDVDHAIGQIIEQEQVIVKAGEVTKKKPRPARRARSKLHISKGVADILLLIAATVAGAVLVLGLFAANDYESRSGSIKSAASLAGSSIPNSEKSITDSIRTQKTKLSTISSCSGMVPKVFSLLIPGAANKESDCMEAVADNKRLKNSLTSLEELSTFLTAQQAVLAPVLKEQSANEFASIPDVKTAWQTARDKLDLVPAGSNFVQFKNTLLFRVNAVVAAWEQLQASNGAKDETAFKTAEANLAAAYESLRASAGDADVMVNHLQAEINGAYKELL